MNYAPRKVITVKTLIDTNNSSEEPKIENYNEKANSITSPQNVISPIKSNNLLSFNILKKYKVANFRRSSMTILPYSSLFPIHSFAYNTHNGNIRSYNEDRITALALPHNVAYFFAIYDGHGGCGCSSFLQSKLHHYLTSIANAKHIENSIMKCENDFISKHSTDNFGNLTDTSGSCVLIAMITQERKIIFVNIGDSRALLLSSDHKVLFATEDHKPNSPTEHLRIIKAGGSIYQNQMNYELVQNGEILKNGPFRVFPGRLSVSRTIGDAEIKEEKFGGKKGIIIPTPDIMFIDNLDKAKYVVMGCDGIYDVLSNEEIATMFIEAKSHCKTREHYCDIVSDMIIKAAMMKESFDNVSCVVIELKE